MQIVFRDVPHASSEAKKSFENIQYMQPNTVTRNPRNLRMFSHEESYSNIPTASISFTAPSHKPK